MSSDLVAWLASEAGLPLLDETASSRVAANDAALALLRGRAWRGLEDAVAGVVGRDADRAALGQTIADARRGQAGSAWLRGAASAGARSGWRCFAMPLPGGRARVLLAPAELSRTARLEQHAAAVDMAAEVSHEVSNALATIAGWAAETAAELPPGLTAPRRSLDLIANRAEEARAASRRLLATARGSAREEAAGEVDLAGLVQEIAELLGPVAKRDGVRVEVVAEPGLPVPGARADLFTVGWNLAKNAVEALEGGGRLRLEARASGPDVAILVVEDDGPGIDEAAIGDVFTAYFTTKESGTGLGLPLVRRTTEELGGHLEVRSPPAPGARGTRFEVRLPLAGAGRRGERPTTGAHAVVRAERPAARGAASGRPAESGAVRRESGVLDVSVGVAARVLIVEDDPALREMLQTTLELRGAYVVATDGSTDVAPLGPFDVAIVDQHLGPLRGDALLDELRTAGVVRRGVLMSGGSMPPSARARGAAPDAWLRKPFDTDDVVRTVRRLVEADAGRTAFGA